MDKNAPPTRTRRGAKLAGEALIVGAAAVLGLAPLAAADPPQSCDQLPPEQQQQCQQDQGVGIANQAIYDAQRGLQANPSQKSGVPANVDVSSAHCVMVDGVPTMIPPTGLVLEGQHDTGRPCYLVFGVEPHL